jgi:predicted P-loop ATPase
VKFGYSERARNGEKGFKMRDKQLSNENDMSEDDFCEDDTVVHMPGMDRPDWLDGPTPWLLDNKGNARVCEANVHAILTDHPDWSGVFAYNVLSESVVRQKKSPIGPAGPAEEEDVVNLAIWLQRQMGMAVKPSMLGAVISAVARVHSINEVCDYLDALKWDGHSRVAHWLSSYMRAEDTEINSAFGVCWLVSAVTRAYCPGCKVDTAIVFESPQGARKSTALAILGGAWFSDAELDFTTKAAAEAIRGQWIVEIGELSRLSRSEVNTVKAFMSRQSDRYRPSYAKLARDFPRRCVFAGTTNDPEYLRDATGNRRWWPVAVGKVDHEALRADRDQLWAEAVVLFRANTKWWLDDEELEKAAREEAEARYQVDPWEPAIEHWLTQPRTTELGHVTTERILLELFEKSVSGLTNVDSQRVGTCLRRLGWHKQKQIRVDAHRIRPYLPETSEAAVTTPVTGQEADDEP